MEAGEGRPEELLEEDVLELVFGQFPALRVAQVRPGICRLEEMPKDLLALDNRLAQLPAGARLAMPATEELALPEEDMLEVVVGQFPAERPAQVRSGRCPIQELPEDVVENILARLPAVCLAQVRSVSRAWNRFITSHTLAGPKKKEPWLLICRTVPRFESSTVPSFDRRNTIYRGVDRLPFRESRTTVCLAFDPVSSRWYNIRLPTDEGSEVEVGKGSGGDSGLVLLRERWRWWRYTGGRPRTRACQIFRYWVGNPLRGDWQKVAFPPPRPDYYWVTDEARYYDHGEYAHELIVDDDTKTFKILHFRRRDESCTVDIYDSGEDGWRQGDTLRLPFGTTRTVLHQAGCTTSKDVVYLLFTLFDFTRPRSLRIVAYLVKQDLFEDMHCATGNLIALQGWWQCPFLFVEDSTGGECRQRAPALLEFGYCPLWQFRLTRFSQDKDWAVVHESKPTLEPKFCLPEPYPCLRYRSLSAEGLQIAGSLDMFYALDFCPPCKLSIFMCNSEEGKWEQVPEHTYPEKEEPYGPQEFSFGTFLPRFDALGSIKADPHQVPPF